MKNVIKDLAAVNAVSWGTIAEKIDENFSELENSIPESGGSGGGGLDESQLGEYLTKNEYAKKSDIPSVPNKVSEFENDAKYVKESGLKTINGQSIVGSGNITIEGSGETIVTQEFVNVKWLGNTGTQYIDTGYVLKEDDEIDVDFYIPDSALSISTDKILIDARDTSNGVRVSTYGNNGKWYARFGHSSGSASAVLSGNQQGTFTIGKSKLILNGSVILENMPYTAMPTGTLKLFTGFNNETGALSAPSYARISGVKIKNNGETIHNYRPMQRTSDNELGFKDAITGDFLTNSGTGVFEYEPSDVVVFAPINCMNAASSNLETSTTAVSVSEVFEIPIN